jgi:predicted DNA repair protein MutK
MAGASLLTLLDDIAAVLKKVSVMTKVAAKKTAGVLGDDLALNAEQVTGVRADRELPVVWAVAKGSAKNKLILVPAALLLSAFLPWLITPLLMIGGAFLCYEGFEKVTHKLLHSREEDEKHQTETIEALNDPTVDIVEFEKAKIKGAVKTDFILSAEIIVIALGVVKESDFITQIGVVTGIAVLMTVGVYALVAGIVKLDDFGLWLTRRDQTTLINKIQISSGRAILSMAPYLMKTLSVVGTIAMFIVGGGILVHGIPHSHEWLEYAINFAKSLPTVGNLLSVITPTLVNTAIGFLLGGLVFVTLMMGQRVITVFK